MNYNKYSSNGRALTAIAVEATQRAHSRTVNERAAMTIYDDELADVIAASKMIHEVRDLTGVLGGVKPSSILDTKIINPSVARHLGLAYAIPRNRDGVEDSGLMTVSRSQKVADHLGRLFTDLWQRNTDFAQNSYDIGELLGYPETSTDYHIKRLLSLRSGEEWLPAIHPKDFEMTGASAGINLSPDHWHQELQDYVLPVRESLQALAPRHYEHMLRAEHDRAMLLGRTGLTSAVIYGRNDVPMKVVE